MIASLLLGQHSPIDRRVCSQQGSRDGDPASLNKLNAPYWVPFTASDPEGDVPKFQFVNGSETHGATLDGVTGVLDWTPSTEGVFAFQVSAVDDLGLGTQLQFRVTVNKTGPNDPPKFDNTHAGIAEVGTPYDMTFPATDPDGDPLVYAILAGPAGMTINAATGRVQWNAPESMVDQNVAVQLSATDIADQIASYQFTFPVRAQNRPPEFTSEARRTETAGRVYRYDVTALDADLDDLVFTLTTKPDGVEFDSQTGRLTWQTTANDIGDHEFTITLTDGRIPTPIQQTWTATITADETQPQVAVSAGLPPFDSLQVDLGQSVDLRLFAIDDVSIQTQTLVIGDTSLTLDSGGNTRHTFDTVGSFLVTGTATDAAGYTVTDSSKFWSGIPATLLHALALSRRDAILY